MSSLVGDDCRVTNPQHDVTGLNVSDVLSYFLNSDFDVFIIMNDTGLMGVIQSLQNLSYRALH